MPTILIGADICPIERNLPLFMEGDAESLFSDLLPEIRASDLSIANLECPLIEQPSPIAKTGPTFGESSSCIKGIKAGGINVLSLANNHILDHGSPGLENTLHICATAGIATVGAGMNLEEARRILVKRVGDLRVGIFSVAEHEFSIATKTLGGANPLDLIDFVRNVRANADSFDYLVVLYHGGDEFHIPSPQVQKTCRFMVEMGANAVIVQHPHCFGGYEEYQGGHIVYGQGALVMDEQIYRDLPSFHEGFLVKLMIEADASSTMELVPFVQSADRLGSRRMISEEEQVFQTEMEKQAEIVRDEALVAERWHTFCQDRRNSYLSTLLGHNRWLRKLNVGGVLFRFLYGRQTMLGIRNVVICETHREALETLLNNEDSN